MAVVLDWIKMRTDLYRDPKVCMMVDPLRSPDGDLVRYVNQNKQRDMAVTDNILRNAAVGAMVSVWGVLRHRGKRVGCDLCVTGATRLLADSIADMPGIGDAMVSVGWLRESGEGLILPNFFKEFNSDPEESERSKATERKRRQRDKKKRDTGVTLSRDTGVTSHGTKPRNVTQRRGEREESERRGREEEETPIANGKKNIHKGEKADRPIGAPNGHSPIDNFLVSEEAWGTAVQFALDVARKIPPKNDADRRAWLRYAVLAVQAFGEHWFVDSVEAVLCSKETKKSRQAHFVAVLKSKAEEQGVDSDTFDAMAKRIEIPVAIWKSGVLR